MCQKLLLNFLQKIAGPGSARRIPVSPYPRIPVPRAPGGLLLSEGEDEFAEDIFFASDPYGFAVCVYYGFGDKQAESGTCFIESAAFIAFIEAVKDVRYVVFGDSRALVIYGYENFFIF